MQRRQVLAALGLTAVSGGAGCTAPLRAVTTSPPRLGWMAVANYSPKPHRFRIEIERDGERVHESTHRLEGKPEGRIPGEVLDCTWGEAPGPYTFRGRVDESDWIERTVADALASYEGTPDCVIARAVYRSELGFEVSPGCDGVSSYDGGCGFANAPEE